MKNNFERIKQLHFQISQLEKELKELKETSYCYSLDIDNYGWYLYFTDLDVVEELYNELLKLGIKESNMRISKVIPDDIEYIDSNTDSPLDIYNEIRK